METTKMEDDPNERRPKWKMTKREEEKNTLGTAGCPGGHDRTLAVKSRKNYQKSAFFRKKIKIT